MLTSLLLASFAILLPDLANAGPVQKQQLQSRQVISNTSNVTASNNATWSWTSGPKMHGVALGNWLILERWMNEDWFVTTCGDSNAIDEWTFSQALGNQTAAVLQEHWNTWITDDDIRIIAESGFNHLRIPLPYWAFIDEPAGTPYLSMGGQVEQLTRVLASADKYGLYVIMDLHALPGSQNGEQETGHRGYNNFYEPANQNYSDATVDAVLAYITASPYRHLMTALAACNEPVYYDEADFETLVAYLERVYAKTSVLDPPLPMMFHPGRPQTPPMELFQGFINGKSPELLIYEDHPYPGRLMPVTPQATLLGQVCQKAQSYADFSIPVAVTEWAVSTAIENNTKWDATFWSAQARAWAQSAGGIFWSYKTIAYTEKYNQTENFTLYSFIDLRNDSIIPLPSPNQTTQEYLMGLNDTCGFGDTSDQYGTIVSSVRPTVTAAFTKRWLPEAQITAAP